MKIVVTGGIGSGKSTLVKKLNKRLPDFKVISIDEIVHDLYQESAVAKTLDSMFGTSVREEISKLVFENQEMRKMLEALFIPLVGKRLQEELDKYANSITEFPLLFELSYQKMFDVVISTIAPRDIRARRVMKRDGKCLSEVEQIMKVQVSDTVRFENSHFTVFTDHLTDSGSTEKDIDQIVLAVRTKMKGKIGLVAGTFDPITLGHAWIIKRALATVDRVIVVVGHNPTKKFFFSDSERVELIRNTLATEFTADERARVELKMLPDDILLVTYADQVGARCIFRGIRTFTDFEYENNFNLVQKKLAPHIDILYLIPPRELTEISSSLVKSVLNLKEWERIAAPYVSAPVLKALREKKKT